MLAMSRRLHSVYAIASDLVSTDGRRDGAAAHRRARGRRGAPPSHVLAVRQTGRRAGVYGRGIGSHEAQALARATLAGEDVLSDSTLAVEVVSSRRAYGQLIARYPNAVEPPGPADARPVRQACRRRARHGARMAGVRPSSRTGELAARAIARSGPGRDEPGGPERLAAAVPEVVDCDRMAVWVWDARERLLRSMAAWGRTPEMAAALREVPVAPEDRTCRACSRSLSRISSKRQPTTCSSAS